MQFSHASWPMTWRITRALVSCQAFLLILDIPRPAAMNLTRLQRPVTPLLEGLRQGAGEPLLLRELQQYMPHGTELRLRMHRPLDVAASIKP